MFGKIEIVSSQILTPNIIKVYCSKKTDLKDTYRFLNNDPLNLPFCFVGLLPEKDCAVRATDLFFLASNRRAVVEQNERGSTFAPTQKYAQAKVTRMEYLFTLSVLLD